MCYSEKLKTDLNAHQTEKGWVLVGHKAVLECEEHPGQYRAIYQGPSGARPDPNDVFGAMYHWQMQYMYAYGRQADRVHYHFKFGEPVEDKHGFHMGGSRRGAVKGLFKSLSVADKDRWEPKARYIRRNCVKYHLIRCLAPDWAIEDNHATVMMALRPGQHETIEDVKKVAEFASQKRSWQTEKPVIEKPEYVADIPSLMPDPDKFVIAKPPSKVHQLVQAMQVARAWQTTQMDKMMRIYGQWPVGKI